MIDYALGFATCLGIAICAPSLFVAIKAKAVALVKRGYAAVTNAKEMD
jgi:hypothetical protein